jgi:hypothetical protein
LFGGFAGGHVYRADFDSEHRSSQHRVIRAERSADQRPD